MRSLALWLLLTLTACSGGSCGGATVPYPDPPPAGGEVQRGAVTAQVTSHLLDLLEERLAVLLGSLLTVEGDRAVFLLDEGLLDPTNPIQLRDGCLGAPAEPCTTPSYRSTVGFPLAGIEDALELAWLPADGSGRPGLSVSLSDIGLSVDLAIAFTLENVGSAACHVRDPEGRAAVLLDELGFDVRLSVDRSGDAPRLAVALENVRVDFGDTTDAAIAADVSPCDGVADPSCVDAACGSECADICGLVDLFAQLGGFIANVLEPVLVELAPVLASGIGGALESSLAGLPLGVETLLDLGGLTGVLAQAEPLHVKAVAGDALAIDGTGLGRGLALGLDAGLAPAALAPCVADAEAPDLSALRGARPSYTGYVEVPDPTSARFEAYDVALSLSEALLAQAAWGAYRGGALCLRLGAEDLGSFALTVGLLSTAEPALAELAPQDAPLLLVLRPRRPPDLRLGAGGVTGTGVREPLIELTAFDLEVDLYVLVDDAPLRLASVTADLAVHLDVEEVAGGELVVSVTELGITRLTQRYNELMPEIDLAELFETLVDLALDNAFGDGLAFPLPGDLLGGFGGLPLSLAVNRIRSDLGPDGAAYLSVYLTLCDEAAGSDENSACFVPVGTPQPIVRAQPSRTLSLTPKEDAPRRWLPGASSLTLELDRDRALARVDSGPWRLLEARDGRVVLRDARLSLLGRHEIAVLTADRDQRFDPRAAARLSVWTHAARETTEATAQGGCAATRGDMWAGLLLLVWLARRWSQPRASRVSSE